LAFVSRLRTFASTTPNGLFALGCVSGLAYAVVAVFFWTDEIFTRGFRTIAVKIVLYLYTWNPMVLMQSLANDHNDS
jgi:hypothetical protein